MAQSGNLTHLPADKNMSSSVTRVIVKTSGKQQDFMVADDTSVREFKEKLAAHFKCQIDQLVLVFMGRLLRDHDTLGQRGILDGHTVHLVIKSRYGSQPVSHSSWNCSSNEPCNRDGDIKRKSSGVCQPAETSQTPVKSPLLVEPEMPKVNTQNLEASSPSHMKQVLENNIQQLPPNTDLMRQIISEHPEMQQLMQQNPEVSHILDNSEVLWQTLELARKLAIIQEIMQIQQSSPNLENPQNLQPYLGLETIPGGNSTLVQNHADMNEQMTNNLQDIFGGNSFTDHLSGQIPEQVQPSLSSPLPCQEQQDKLPQLPTIQVIYTSSCGLFSGSATPSRENHTSSVSATAISTKDQNCPGTIQQSVEVPTLLSIEPTQWYQEEGMSLNDLESKLEDELLLLAEQTNSQITGSVIRFLMNNPSLAAKIMLFMKMPQLSEQWRQQMSTFLQQIQLSDLLLSLANPKASQGILKIEQGLQLLATEAPVLLPWIAPYLWGLGWLPAPSCTHPDMASWSWDVPDIAGPKESESCHRFGAVFQRLQTLTEDPSNSIQAQELLFSQQMESLRALGFGNHHENLQALIATEGDTSAAIRKLKRSQGP